MKDLTIAQSIARSSDPYKAAVQSDACRYELRGPDNVHTATRYRFDDGSELDFKVAYELLPWSKA